MPANPEFSRRHLFKIAAGSAALAFIGARGRANAQEAQPQATPESNIEIPKFETLEDQIQGFTALVTGNMRPKALNSLGLTPNITEEALKKQYASGAFITNKESPIPEDQDLVFLEYSLEIPKIAHPFGSWYVYEDTKRDGLWENIVFVGDAKQGLRQNGDDAPVAYDDLQPNAEFFFNLPTDGMTWKDFSDLVPETEKDKYKGMGIIGEWEKDTPLIEGIVFQLQTNGFVGYTYFKGEPQPAQKTQGSQQKINTGLEMAHRGQEMVIKRMSTRFDSLRMLNIPQV